MNRLGKSLPPLASLLPFEAAARLESFTKAAEELHLTQAAVSRQIRALEDDLCTRLFERRNRAVHLTDAGREIARVIGGALEGIAAHAGQLRGINRTGEVVFFSQLCEAFYWVMPRLSEFHQRHPEIEVRVAASTRPLTEAMTPPVGWALFFLKGVAPPEVSSKDIYVGVMPFVALQLVGLVLLFMYPSIATWLPKAIGW